LVKTRWLIVPVEEFVDVVRGQAVLPGDPFDRVSLRGRAGFGLKTYFAPELILRRRLR
jgi:hypothetical protein